MDQRAEIVFTTAEHTVSVMVELNDIDTPYTLKMFRHNEEAVYADDVVTITPSYLDLSVKEELKMVDILRPIDQKGA